MSETMTNQELFDKMKEKLEGYEKVLDSILQEPPVIATITAGPMEDEDNVWYRVKSSKDETLVRFTENLMFDVDATLEIGREVLVQKGAIVSVTPQPLLPKKEPVEFDFIHWDAIGGLRSQVERIRDAVETPIYHADLFKEYGLQPINGILLYGPPGCGSVRDFSYIIA